MLLLRFVVGVADVPIFDKVVMKETTANKVSIFQ
jgi:hypothetical protein